MAADGSYLVTFQGQTLWYLPDNLVWGDTGPLAPLDHCDEDGNIIDPLGTSYGHYFANEDSIYRFGQVVGKLADLVRKEE